MTGSISQVGQVRGMRADLVSKGGLVRGRRANPISLVAQIGGMCSGAGDSGVAVVVPFWLCVSCAVRTSFAYLIC